jgi:hypothetical protein
MGSLFDSIRLAVAEERYVLSIHAVEKLRERRIEEWQAASGLADGRLLSERPGDTPNPSVEVEQTLPDGTPVKAVWAWLTLSRLARLVTIHFYDTDT